MTSVPDIALRWAAVGPVFPVHTEPDPSKGPRGTAKRPLTAHGHLDASQDPEVLARMPWGKANAVGLDLGRSGAGLAALDVDTVEGHGEDGGATLTALTRQHGPLPDAPVNLTPSGGEHQLYKAPGLRGRSGIAPGLDLKAGDGWIVVAGRVAFPDGPEGRWEPDAARSILEGHPVPDLPAHVAAMGSGPSTNGSTRGTGRWQKVNRAELHPADLAALVALETLGGHNAHLGPAGELRITRPDKTAGASATVGYIGPGIVRVFTSGWHGLPEGVYDADRLTKLAAGDEEEEAEGTGARGERGGPIRPVTLAPATSIAIARPVWAWERRIPVAGVTLMPGREGLGKTALAAHLMAAWTRGTLAGNLAGTPRDVVYCGQEDDRASVMVPRLVAAGADLDRVLFLDMPRGASFTIGEDTASLGAAMTGRDVAAVIIDPLDAHLGGKVDSHKKAEVQSTLAALADLTQTHRCGLLGLGHLNKGESLDVLTKVVGSVGFTTSVRAVLAVGEHPEDPADRVCVLRKANMTDRASVPAVRFRVEGTEVPHPDGGVVDTARIVVVGEEHGFDADTILTIPDAEERTARADAVDWLADVLADGPTASKELKRMAKDADVSEPTLHRARRELGVIVARDKAKRGGPTTWSLPFVSPVPEGFGVTPPATLLTRNQNPPPPGKSLPRARFRFTGEDPPARARANRAEGDEAGGSILDDLGTPFGAFLDDDDPDEDPNRSRSCDAGLFHAESQKLGVCQACTNPTTAQENQP